MRARSILGAVLLLGLTAAAAPESRLEKYFRLRQEAGAAAQTPDLTRAEALLEEALQLYPTSPGSLIRLARVEAAAGKPAEAVAHLEAYAGLGLTWNIAGDPVLAPLADREDFATVAARLEANAAPVGKLIVEKTLPDSGEIYEGLAWSRDGWLVSSVTRKTILRVTARGEVLPFLRGDAATGAIFGLATDEPRGLLWAVEASGPEIPGSGGEARSALLKIDLSSGALLARYPLPADDKTRQLGDVALGADGAVYVSDALGAGLYRLPKGGTALELLFQTNEMRSPQGMVACGPDTLLIADYSTGLHRLDLKQMTLTPVGGLKAALAGTDGLFAVSFDFHTRNASPLPLAVVATQNGVSPQRVMLLRMRPDCREIEDLTVLAANQDAIEDMTLGAASPGGAAFIGQGGWSGFGADGKPVAGHAARDAAILTAPLPGH
ncbi:MAG: hypothetical protein KF842_15505 [Caulobacter sp.]|nr:hypothetical protein [Caulobacter sp.]